MFCRAISTMASKMDWCFCSVSGARVAMSATGRAGSSPAASTRVRRSRSVIRPNSRPPSVNRMDDTRSSAMRCAALAMLSPLSICTGGRLISSAMGAASTLPGSAAGAAAGTWRGNDGSSMCRAGWVCATALSASTSSSSTRLSADATACTASVASTVCTPAPNSSPGCRGSCQSASASAKATAPEISQPMRPAISSCDSTTSPPCDVRACHRAASARRSASGRRPHTRWVAMRACISDTCITDTLGEDRAAHGDQARRLGPDPLSQSPRTEPP